MLGYLERAYWKFMDARSRNALAPRLEEVLRAGMAAASSPSLKSAWFSALRDTALTPPTVEFLQRVWRKSEDVPGLVLAEPDYIQLAQALAVRGVAGADAILGEQIARTQNPDRKAQMEFVRPALSTDEKTREVFFASLQDAKNRRRESWVLEAVAYLHHPLRAAAAEKYIGPSLELVREIQRTGDIFFPKRWTDATLSGHSTKTAAQVVRAFVDALPTDYPPRLRLVILSSADDLFRAARMPPAGSKDPASPRKRYVGRVLDRHPHLRLRGRRLGLLPRAALAQIEDGHGGDDDRGSYEHVSSPKGAARRPAGFVAGWRLTSQARCRDGRRRR